MNNKKDPMGRAIADYHKNKKASKLTFGFSVFLTIFLLLAVRFFQLSAPNPSIPLFATVVFVVVHTTFSATFSHGTGWLV